MELICNLLFHTKDKDARSRELLIESNLGLVKAVSRRYENRGVAADDLFQIGVIGLIKAVDRFDASRSLKFSTYAVPLISGEIKNYFREDGLIKVSRSLKGTSLKIKKIIAEYEARYASAPSLSYLSKLTGLSSEEILPALEATDDVLSLNDEYLFQLKTDSSTEAVLNHMFLKSLMDKLDSVEKKLVLMRYFEELTQEETAKRLLLSQVQVSRMEKRVLKRMRTEAIAK